MKKKSLNLIVGLLMIGAVFGGLALVKNNQDTRRGAYFAGTNLLLQPTEIQNSVGSLVPVQLWLETDGGAKVSSADVTVCYDTNLSLDENNLDKQIILNTEVLQDLIVKEMPAHLDVVGAKQCLRMVAIASPSTKPEDLKSGMVKLLTINFSAANEGSGEIIILKDSAKIGGHNPAAGATDTALKVGTVTGATFTITPGGSDICETDADCPPGFECYQPLMPTCPPGDNCLHVMPPKYCRPIQSQWPVLNYKVQFAFVKTDDSKCFVSQDWPLQVIVMGGGVTKVYNGVVPNEIDKTGLYLKMQGSLVLEGFNQTENVAVFMKGPKHLQMKYAVANQKEPYEKAGGELTLTKLASTSLLYDFSAYPMLAGDVVGANSESQDGWINGVDYSYIKTRADLHKTVTEGTYLKGDLDGQCQVNANDVNELKNSLEQKQEELY